VTDYLLLFASAFLASTLLPLPSEVALLLVIRERGEMWMPVAVATIGNCLGAATTYFLFRMAVRHLDAAHTPRWTRAAALVERFGGPALLLSWVPIVGDAIVALAGASRMAFPAFAIWTTVGKALRYVAVAWAVV
jgi:membrane protein YqaA with SNARE-associated domain